MLEKDDLEKMEGSESIDIGDKEVGEWQDHVRKIKCPKCNDTMINMVDKEQFHIHYELCPLCYGTFFDAGEFRDLKENTILERFKDMLDTLRSSLK
ncbi:TFIIB-type zinc ribbon-containing protein [Kaarinaea lacus]